MHSYMQKTKHELQAIFLGKRFGLCYLQGTVALHSACQEWGEMPCLRPVTAALFTAP